jgi:hypothetical protein
LAAVPLALDCPRALACSRVFVNDRALAKVAVRSMDLPLVMVERPKGRHALCHGDVLLHGPEVGIGDVP